MRHESTNHGNYARNETCTKCCHPTETCIHYIDQRPKNYHQSLCPFNDYKDGPGNDITENDIQETTSHTRHHTLGVIRCGFENLPKSCWFDASKTAESPPQSHVTCRNSIHLPNIHHRPKHSYCISQQACWVNHLGRAAGKRHDKYATITRADHQHYTCLIEQLR